MRQQGTIRYDVQRLMVVLAFPVFPVNSFAYIMVVYQRIHVRRWVDEKYLVCTRDMHYQSMKHVVVMRKNTSPMLKN